MSDIEIPKYQVLGNLCTYDSRNPGYVHFEDDDSSKLSLQCFCDNCFYGRDKLAREILRLRDVIDVTSIAGDI
jgi:hypothetical protein